MIPDKPNQIIYCDIDLSREVLEAAPAGLWKDMLESKEGQKILAELSELIGSEDESHEA